MVPAMDTLAGFYLGVICTICLLFVAAGLWYIETTTGWDHKPTHEEVGQRIIEDYILPEGGDHADETFR